MYYHPPKYTRFGPKPSPKKMSLGSLFRSEQKPPIKDDTITSRECLIAELEFQMREAQHKKWEQEREEKRKQGVPDYSWLVSTPPKYYEIPTLQQLELDELCSKVRPQESGKIIVNFRRILERGPRVDEMPAVLKAIIKQTIQQRPPEESLAGWVSRRAISAVRTRTVRVTPINVEETHEQRIQRRAMSLPDFRARPVIQPRSLPEYCANLDDLPV